MGVEDFVHIPVSPLTGGTKTPEFLKIQPFARIPVLEDEGHVIYESRTLMRYIADKHKDRGPNLLGEMLMDRALVNQWIDVEGHTFSPPVMVLVYERVFKPHLHKRPCDEERWKEAREKVRGRVERRRAFGLFSPLVVYERVFKPHLHKR
ncbi:unnamed protein product [Closterium sp. NIES-65]|nr:unnamed protein product [Closterium sp. NIES-65]